MATTTMTPPEGMDMSNTCLLGMHMDTYLLGMHMDAYLLGMHMGTYLLDMRMGTIRTCVLITMATIEDVDTARRLLSTHRLHGQASASFSHPSLFIPEHGLGGFKSYVAMTTKDAAQALHPNMLRSHQIQAGADTADSKVFFESLSRPRKSPRGKFNALGKKGRLFMTKKAFILLSAEPICNVR